MSDRDLSSAEPFDDFMQDQGDTSPVQNFDDEVSSEIDDLSRRMVTLNVSQCGDPEEEYGEEYVEELLRDNLERLLVRDYHPIPFLDRYDCDVIRAAADKVFLRLDREEETVRSDANCILYDEHDDDEASRKNQLLTERAGNTDHDELDENRRMVTLNVSQCGDPGEEYGEEYVEELLRDNLERLLVRDYHPIPFLDRYDCDAIRAAADKAFLRLDREEETVRSDANCILYDEHDDDEASQKNQLLTERAGNTDHDELDENIIKGVVNLQDTEGHSVAEWVTKLGPRTKIASLFKYFLCNDVTSNGAYLYKDKIKRMCESNLYSLEVEFPNLANKQHTLALFLTEAPSEMISIFNKIAKDVVLSMYPQYPQYRKVTAEIFTRITDLPLVEEIRTLKKIHLNQLIRIRGVVTSTTAVLSQLGIIKYKRTKCGQILGSYHFETQSQNEEVNPGSCPECQSAVPFMINKERTLCRNYQKISIQESPGTIPPGHIPRSIECVLLADLCGQCKPGDEIDVTGIYSNSYEASFHAGNRLRVFATVIMANYLIIKDNKHIIESLSDEDVSQILKLSKDHKIGERIAASIAPSIIGYSYIKKSLALALFGGEPKIIGDKYELRGDINILLCGGPGRVKSQFLKYVEKVAPRAIYTTCLDDSADGFTAHVKRDHDSNEWILKAGALVLADQGVCIIDEFDKMNFQDIISIHEAMKQQSIYISKLGLVASLQARCSVIAAVNPKFGRYYPDRTFPENVILSEPIMSRFDILCVMRDELDQAKDRPFSTFLARNQSELGKPFPTSDVELIPQDLLKKYIIYSKQNIHPKLDRLDQEKVAKMYCELRQDSMMAGSLPITVQHIESIIRMAEANAKIHLRDYVEEDDVNMAIRIMLEYYIETQKYSVMKIMRKTFQKYLSFKKDITEHLFFILYQMANDQLAYIRHFHGVTVDTIIELHEKDFKDKVKGIDVHDFRPFYESKLFKDNNFFYDEYRHLILQTLCK